MSEEKVKLSYVAAQLRVKAELTKQMALNSPSGSDGLIQRAKNKLQREQEKGNLVKFSIYHNEFKEFWQRLQKAEAVGLNQAVSFVLGEGVPAMEGLIIEPPSHEKAVASITFSSKLDTIRSWRLEWLVYEINNSIKQFSGSESKVNPAQVQGAWLRAAAGETIDGMLLGAAPVQPTPEEIKAKPYSIIANKARQEVSLILRDIMAVQDQSGIQKVLGLVKEATNKVSSQFGGRYHILRRELLIGINTAKSGPELVGMNLPVVILGSSVAGKAPVNNSFNLQYPGAGALTIVVSSSGLEASVVDFDPNLYKNAPFELNGDWIRNEMKRHGISPELNKNYITNIEVMIRKKINLTGKVIAAGTKSKGGRLPYLHLSFKDYKATKEIEEAQVIDLRSVQQNSLVKEGQLVAELKYREPPVLGRDVYGGYLEAANNEKLRLSLGDGIIEKEVGKYYATMDGMPVFLKNTLYVSKILVHKGDVNLKSGNIIFDGPVEVTGSIDMGAYVQTAGDLTVNGTVRGAIIRCGGNLTVKSGIVTGEKGLVMVRGSVHAEFIENSKIQCGGDITISKVLINSDVISGGSIIATDRSAGLIAGGVISCRQHLKSGSVGFRHGNKTYFNIGVDWKAELSVRIREGRLKKVQQAQKSDRQALREVMSQKKAKGNAKLQGKKEYYQKRLIRARELIEKLSNHLNEAKSQLIFDPDAMMFVHQTLHMNIEVKVGGNPILVTREMAGVGVLGKKKGGEWIVSVEAANRIEKGNKAS